MPLFKTLTHGLIFPHAFSVALCCAYPISPKFDNVSICRSQPKCGKGEQTMKEKQTNGVTCVGEVSGGPRNDNRTCYKLGITRQLFRFIGIKRGVGLAGDYFLYSLVTPLSFPFSSSIFSSLFLFFFVIFLFLPHRTTSRS